MRRILFDSDVTSSWHDALPEWTDGIQKAIDELSKHGAELGFFVSAVTFQEMLYYACTQGRVDAVDTWLRETFTPLALDHEAGKLAAKMQFATGLPQKAKPKTAHKTNLDRWSRDCAILGTAIRHKMDVIVTADGGFYERRNKAPCSILHVREGGVFEWDGYRTPG